MRTQARPANFYSLHVDNALKQLFYPNPLFPNANKWTWALRAPKAELSLSKARNIETKAWIWNLYAEPSLEPERPLSSGATRTQWHQPLQSSFADYVAGLRRCLSVSFSLLISDHYLVCYSGFQSSCNIFWSDGKLPVCWRQQTHLQSRSYRESILLAKRIQPKPPAEFS